MLKNMSCGYMSKRLAELIRKENMTLDVVHFVLIVTPMTHYD